jgi:hypothetical protein
LGNLTVDLYYCLPHTVGIKFFRRDWAVSYSTGSLYVGVATGDPLPGTKNSQHPGWFLYSFQGNRLHMRRIHRDILGFFWNPFLRRTAAIEAVGKGAVVRYLENSSVGK